MLDTHMFGVKNLPYIGFDMKLTKLAIIYAHTYRLPGVGKMHVHRTKQGTSSQTRANVAATYIPNILQKTGITITDNCIECRRNGPTIFEEQLVHHRMQMDAPYANIAVDIIGPFFCKASAKTRAIAKV